MAKTDTMPSMASLLRCLKEGETFSRVRRVDVGGEEACDLTGAIAKLRNQINQGVSKLRKELDDRDFRVESGICLTDDKTAHLVTVAVTRIGEADEADTTDDEDDDDEVDI